MRNLNKILIFLISFEIIFGGGVWVMSFAYAGFEFGQQEFVRKNFTMLMMGIIVVSLLPMVFHAVKAKLAAPAK